MRTEAREPREACSVLGGCLGGGRLRAGASGKKAGRRAAAPGSLRAVVPGEAAAFPLSEAAGDQTAGKAKMILKCFSHCPAHIVSVPPLTIFSLQFGLRYSFSALLSSTLSCHFRRGSRCWNTSRVVLPPRCPGVCGGCSLLYPASLLY